MKDRLLFVFDYSDMPE